MIAQTCRHCGALVTAENQSHTTAELGEPVFCSNCDDLAFAHVVTERFVAAFTPLLSVDGYNKVDKVAGALLHRLHASFQSLVALRKEGAYIPGNRDPETILRAMYDAALQVEYLLKDPNNSETLAQDFLDFQEIERHKMIEALKKYDNDFTRKLLNSPKRASYQPAIDAAFARIERRFRKANGGYRETWHGKNLRELCKTRDREEEFDFVIVALHGATHSSPMTVLTRSPNRPITVFVVASSLLMRSLGAILEYKKIEVDAELRAEIELARQNLIRNFVDEGNESLKPPKPAGS